MTAELHLIIPKFCRLMLQKLLKSQCKGRLEKLVTKLKSQFYKSYLKSMLSGETGTKEGQDQDTVQVKGEEEHPDIEDLPPSIIGLIMRRACYIVFLQISNLQIVYC